MVMRGAKRKGVRYYGPFAHAYAIRETLDLLLRTFPIRTCTQAKFDRHHRLGRPCLYAHIEKCAAPCVGAVQREEYDQLVGELLEFLDGDHSPVLDRLDKQMHGAADSLEYERAARLRDQITSVRKVIERQQMVGPKEEDFDCIGLAEDPLEASVQVFFVRKGRVVGRKGLVVDKVEELEPAALVGRILEQLYGDVPATDVPREVLVPVLPDDAELYEEFLTTARGSRVRVRVPQRGAKRQLLGTVTHNAGEAFARHKLKRASDHNARARALTALQDALDLPEAPLRIEGTPIGTVRVAPIADHTLDEEEHSLLREAADRAALSIRRAQLHEEEHRIAVELQRGLIPPQVPSVEGLEVAAHYEAAGVGAEVGGDWYDAFVLPGRRLGVVLGDVAGSGIRAASTMGQLRSVTRAFALSEDSCRKPGEVLTLLNGYRVALEELGLFTVLYAIISPAEGRFELRIRPAKTANLAARSSLIVRFARNAAKECEQLPA